jgi:ketosteroid isomerase-like protein
MAEPSVLSPTEVAVQVRRMVAGEEVSFADLFAADGLLEYPFDIPGIPRELRGQEAIRAHFAKAPASRAAFRIEDVSAIIHQTDDPEVVITQIEHRGTSTVTGRPYRSRALGIIRVRHGRIVHYQDYMDPIGTARMLGRTDALVAALRAES